MTAEVSFAKTFLASLDSRPVKLQSDHAVDLKTLELNSSYTLPRMPQPMKRPDQTSAPGSERGITILLKSLRNPPVELSLPAQPLSTTVLELKQRLATELGLGATEKIRLLHAKKPCPDSKTVKDVIGNDNAKGTVEITVMIMGGMSGKSAEVSSSMKDVSMDDAPVAQGESGLPVMESPEFWSDLQSFLEQRIRNQEVAAKASKIFAEAWKERE